MEKELNKKRATFWFKGKKFEIDELMDATGRDEDYGEYDVFFGNNCVAHISAGINEPRERLIRLAKDELRNVNEL